MERDETVCATNRGAARRLYAGMCVGSGRAYLRGMSLIAHPYVGRPEEDRLPHRHAIALALASGARLLSVHAASGGDPVDVEAVGPILEGWGQDPASVRHESRIHECCDDPVDTVLDALTKSAPELVVLGTTQRKGALRVFLESRAETIADHLAVPALIVPTDARSLVGEDGSLGVTKVVIPCGDALSTRAAIDRLTWLVERYDLPQVEARLTHVGTEDRPDVTPPEHPRVQWVLTEVPGELEDALAAAARDADLVIMATRGHDTWADRILGSHTERLLRLLDTPLLSVPIES